MTSDITYGFTQIKRTATYCFEEKLSADAATSSSSWTTIGTFLQPADLSIFSNWLIVLSSIIWLHKSILFITIKNGIFSATTNPRCSLVVPTK